MACGVILTAAPRSFTTCSFTRHSASIGVVLASIEFVVIANKLPKIQNAPQGAGKSIGVFLERQVPLEVETTRFFNVNLC